MPQTFVKRPTSPLHFDCLDAPPSDVFWPASDDEANEDERERKKLRIETLGKQYLEGRPLFIQCAGLRGPFDRNWVNPWAAERRYRGMDLKGSSEASNPEGSTTSDVAKPQDIPSTAKKRSIGSINVEDNRENAAGEEVWEEPRPKRRRLEEIGGALGPSTENLYRNAIPESRDRPPSKWLRRDQELIPGYSREEDAALSPIPLVTYNSETAGIHQPRMSSSKARSVHEEPNDDGRSEVKGTTVAHSRAVDVLPTSKVPILQAPASIPNPTHRRPIIESLHESVGVRLRQLDPYKPGGEHRVGRDGDRLLSQEDPMQATLLKDHLLEAKKPILRSPSGEVPDTRKSVPSRLPPYVSDVVHNETATSAGLKATLQNVKVSPRTTSSSIHRRDFHYRYRNKQSVASILEREPKSLRQPAKPSARARSESISSSGSSDFAEAFEAAQAKATSGSLVSSHSPSPMVDKSETRSIKEENQAMKRLTFTSSGEPKLVKQFSSSCRSLTSSAVGTPALSRKRSPVQTEKSDEDAGLLKTCTKSSDKSLMNGAHPRESVHLPEAQVVSDKPAPHVELPSGPSTNLMETDTQSPAFVSLGEEDSYLDLSTQAAIHKAQCAFQDNLISPPKRLPTLLNATRETTLTERHDGANSTPVLHGHPRRTAVIKSESQDVVGPMSTQAIIDGISPYAITTSKKRPQALKKRTSFALDFSGKPSSPAPSNLFPDPSPTFRKPLSLATTPPGSQSQSNPPISQSRPNTASKPPSSSTSLSMLPNGTLVESSAHPDGQQPQHYFHIGIPPDPLSTLFADTDGNDSDGDHSQSSWDMDAAIEEAANFLRNWDVEAEARKEGSLSKEKDGAPKGILSSRKGNS